MDEWEKTKWEEIIEGVCDHYSPQILRDPEKALSTIEQELNSQAIYQGNNWTGRGVVGDTVISATIAGLEIVRSDCLVILKDANSKG